jgi:hypothetical protein
MFRLVMGFFDERVLKVLGDGKPRASISFWGRWASPTTL